MAKELLHSALTEGGCIQDSGLAILNPIGNAA